MHGEGSSVDCFIEACLHLVDNNINSGHLHMMCNVAMGFSCAVLNSLDNSSFWMDHDLLVHDNTLMEKDDFMN